MSGIYGFFRSYFHSPPGSGFNESQKRKQDIAGYDYDVSLDTTVALNSPLVGDNAIDTNLSGPGTETTSSSANRYGTENIDNVEKPNSLHITSHSKKAALYSTINTITDREKQHNTEIQKLEMFMMRRLGYESDNETRSSASGAHHYESCSDHDQLQLQSKPLHQPTTINITSRRDNHNGNEGSQYLDAITKIPETQLTGPTSALQESEYQQGSRNTDSLLQTQPAMTIDEHTQGAEKIGKSFSPLQVALQTQADPIIMSWQASLAINNTSTEESSELPSQLPKTRKRKKIPSFGDTTHNVTSVHDLNLRSKTFNLELAQVRLIWLLQKTKILRRGRKRGNGALVRRGDFGPLAHVFKSVLSMELMELEDSSPVITGKDAKDERRNIVRQTAARAFSNAPSATSSTITLENVETGPKIRRIRLFLYGDYAIQMGKLLTELEQRTPMHYKDTETKKKKSLQDLFVISLRNIPAQCIFPLGDQFPFEECASGLLNTNYGRLSQFCICLGGESLMMNMINDADDARIRFDSTDFEMRVLELVRHNEDKRHYTAVKKITGEEREYLFTRSNCKDSPKVLARAASSGMAECYTKIFSRRQTKTRKETQEEIASVCSDNISSSRKRKAPSMVYSTLLELEEMINSSPHRNSTRSNFKSPMVNVIGTVLGIRPPQFTKKKDWMMRITLTDDSLPNQVTKRPLHASTTAQGIECNTTKETKREISHATLLIFAEKIDELPRVSYAGDILRVHRAKLQKWSGKVQLICPRLMSSVVVCRPVTAILQQYLGQTKSSCQTVPSDNSTHWQVHNTKKLQVEVDFLRTSELWRWAQVRLANYPTTEESKNISQAHSDKNKSSYGDLTVMITKIIPIQIKKACHLPRGFLRVWDGSGRPISDKEPHELSESKGFNDPPSQALSSIANIISTIPFDGISTNAINPPKRLCGRVINIAIWEDSHWNLLINAHTFVGNFVRLRNIRLNLRDLPTGNEEVIGLSVDSDVCLTPLPIYTYEIKRLLVEHNTRIVQNHEFNPNSGYLPLKVRKDLGRQKMYAWYKHKFPEDDTLCTLLQCMMGEVPFSFHTRFAIKRISPSFDNESTGIIALCAKGNNNQNDADESENKIYRFAMRIYDSTTECDIIVPNSAGQQLIGIGAKDLFNPEHICQHQDVIKKLNACIEVSKLYRGTIQSIMVKGAKYFVLDSISPVVEESANNSSNSLSHEV